MKVSHSRKSTHSIMSHEGFGTLTVVHAGIAFIVPQKCISSAGSVKKHFCRLINNCNTIADAQKLYKFGIEVTSA